MDKRIDAHQHFWQYNPVEHGWMTDEMAAIRRDFLPQDLKPLLDRAGFDGCVAVQARQNLDETRWLLELAARHDFIFGVVGWVDLRSPELQSQLLEFADRKKLVGVRHVVQDEPDDEFMLREDFRRGIGWLEEFGLAYDVLIYPRQLRAAIQLVQQFPRQRFVLDHIAKPPIAEGSMEPWGAGVRELAQAPNLYCKLSGMVTEACWGGWQTDDFRPYLDGVLEAFGCGRLMIGSDWPVCTLSASYEAAMGIVLEYVGRLTAAEQAGILGGNCARYYKLLPAE
ncbi:MAG TPA: amidohydrolase family protein [Terracidiphilus sp.]|jgi:L-fuconolactonase